MKSKSKFEILLQKTEDLRSRYMRMIAAFHIFETFLEAAAPNKVGKKKANNNVRIFSRYKNFFVNIKEACRTYFFLELAKFFETDKRDQSLTLEHILSYAEKNLSSFSREEFIKFNSERNRTVLDFFINTYTPLTKKDISTLKRRLKRNTELIKRLKDYRDEHLVHDDIKKKEISIKAGEVKILKNIVKDVISLFYLRLDLASNDYRNFSEEPVRAVNNIIKNLQDFEMKEKI